MNIADLRIPRALWPRDDLSEADKLTYAWLRATGAETKRALANWAHVSTRTMARRLARLIDAKLVRAQRRRGLATLYAALPA